MPLYVGWGVGVVNIDRLLRTSVYIERVDLFMLIQRFESPGTVKRILLVC